MEVAGLTAGGGCSQCGLENSSAALIGQLICISICMSVEAPSVYSIPRAGPHSHGPIARTTSSTTTTAVLSNYFSVVAFCFFKGYFLSLSLSLSLSLLFGTTSPNVAPLTYLNRTIPQTKCIPLAVCVCVCVCVCVT